LASWVIKVGVLLSEQVSRVIDVKFVIIPLMKSCESNIRFLSQNVCRLSLIKQEDIWSFMRKKNVFAFCLQETWKLGTQTTSSLHGEFMMITNGVTIKPPRGRIHIPGGVAIVLNTEGQLAWNNADNQMSRFGERILAICLVVRDKKKK
jgi:hypothetical protein